MESTSLLVFGPKWTTIQVHHDSCVNLDKMKNTSFSLCVLLPRFTFPIGLSFVVSKQISVAAIMS